MTAERAALVERVAEAIRSRPHFASLDHARHLVDMIRDLALEEAVKVVTQHYEELCTEHRLLLMNRAAAIRALKSTA